MARGLCEDLNQHRALGRTQDSGLLPLLSSRQAANVSEGHSLCQKGDDTRSNFLTELGPLKHSSFMKTFLEEQNIPDEVPGSAPDLRFGTVSCGE